MIRLILITQVKNHCGLEEDKEGLNLVNNKFQNQNKR